MKAFTHKMSDNTPIELHDHHIFEQREAERDKAIERDYEPEQSYGTAHDIQEHIRYGGTREDY